MSSVSEKNAKALGFALNRSPEDMSKIRMVHKMLSIARIETAISGSPATAAAVKPRLREGTFLMISHWPVVQT